MLPKSVVPAVATTAIGSKPSRRQRSSSLARAVVRIRLRRSHGTRITACSSRPSSIAALTTLK